LCATVPSSDAGQPDPIGTDFTFERGVSKVEGGDEWADVWETRILIDDLRGQPGLSGYAGGSKTPMRCGPDVYLVPTSR
jgi:hypothetical protein